MATSISRSGSARRWIQLCIARSTAPLGVSPDPAADARGRCFDLYGSPRNEGRCTQPLMSTPGCEARSEPRPVAECKAGCYDQFMYLWRKRRMLTLLLVGALLAILPSYLWSYSLTGASEAPTILLGDTFIVNRAAYDLRVPYSRITLFHTGSPRRGDIVQAQLPANIGLGIKRVIGLPGETIEVRENRVIINGRPLPIQPLNGADFAWVPAAHGMGSAIVVEDGHWAAYTTGKSVYRNCSPVKLRPGEYFLMGDNRDNSFDSRAFGPVAQERILGKAIAVLPTGRRVRNYRN